MLETVPLCKWKESPANIERLLTQTKRIEFPQELDSDHTHIISNFFPNAGGMAVSRHTHGL